MGCGFIRSVESRGKRNRNAVADDRRIARERGIDCLHSGRLLGCVRYRCAFGCRNDGSALMALVDGDMIHRLASRTRLQVQRRAALIAELGRFGIGLAAEVAGDARHLGPPSAEGDARAIRGILQSGVPCRLPSALSNVCARHAARHPGARVVHHAERCFAMAACQTLDIDACYPAM